MVVLLYVGKTTKCCQCCPTNKQITGNYQQKKPISNFQICSPTSVTKKTMDHQYILTDMYGYCLCFRPIKIKGSKTNKMKHAIHENEHNT